MLVLDRIIKVLLCKLERITVKYLACVSCIRVSKVDDLVPIRVD